ncbi:PAS domain-containing sensor histidine kinase [Desulfuromonas sp. DDH964]|uniref:PAS domain-containing sensor histidine kinase n=1 Tax=Desulfuromonas sp. DDH964 TaxID=1823759 RepID=UPI00078DF3E8|nr:ATP-binding protein [Desulfuromonas sp. DDH964]AMV73262.1 sensor histidine kinase, PAS, PAS, PAS and PAS domain-containing [Desulfuromonas sp. DDH964]
MATEEFRQPGKNWFRLDQLILGGSPLRILPLMVLSIFLAEFSVMLILDSVGELDTYAGALLDAVMLLLFLSPTFYLFHYRPLMNQYQARKAALERLLESEERLNTTLDAVNDGVWDWDLVGGSAYFSPRCRELVGCGPDEPVPALAVWQTRIHPDDRRAALVAWNDHLAGRIANFEAELRLPGEAKAWSWILVRGRVVKRDEDGTPLRAVGTIADIGLRKEAEAALRQQKADIRQLSHQLMHSVEMEKKHLARDLHDEFGQVLAVVQLGVEMLKEGHWRNQEEFQFHCDRLLASVARLRTEIRQTCDRLLPAMLEELGLAATLEWLTGEFSMQKTGFRIDFAAEPLEETPGGDGAIALYRICQEALNNVLKHAAASAVRVRLRSQAGGVELEIVDDGRGFVPGPELVSVDGHWGIGLFGMHERALAVGGKVQVTSEPGQGTRVCAWVPLLTEEE